ncbi:MAG: class I SAM-dependent DNA methyltransferase [Halanaerobiales bacterium]
MSAENNCYTNSFARIYDDLMSSVPYELWYNYLRELLTYYKFTPSRVLDLACGTGEMTFKFAGDYDKIIGIDKSREMLKKARGKIEASETQIEFKCADLRDFELEEKYDFAFCLFDSLNYILNLQDLANVYENVSRSLTEAGLFIFDMNTPARLMSIEQGTTMFKGDGYTCFWEDVVNEEKKLWKVRLKIYFDGSDEYHKEVHRETAYKKKEVLKRLNRAGFQKVEVFRAYTFNSGDDDDNRLYYVCFKDKGVYQRASSLKKIKNKMKWKLMNFRCL